MTVREYPVFTVTPKAERSLRAGHPWVYGEEVTAVAGQYRNGDMVDVVSSKGRYLGTGWVNDHSKIRVRVISRNANDVFDEAFFRRRVRYALDYRKTVMGETDYHCCRLIFGEADQFPGLTVDRFENVLVTQVLSLGMEQRKAWVYRALVELLREAGETIDAIYDKNKNLFGVFAWAVNIPLIIALIFTPALVGKWKGMYKLNLRGYILAVIGRALVVVAGYLGSVPLILRL